MKCCICGRKLKTPEALRIGLGPICAKTADRDPAVRAAAERIGQELRTGALSLRAKSIVKRFREIEFAIRAQELPQ